MRSVSDFAGDEPPFDDETIVVIKRDSVPPLPAGGTSSQSGEEGRGEGDG
jgi:hypothetical protein